MTEYDVVNLISVFVIVAIAFTLKSVMLGWIFWESTKWFFKHELAVMAMNNQLKTAMRRQEG